MKVSRSETEYMCMCERDTGVTVKLQEAEGLMVDEIKYLEPSKATDLTQER